MQAGVQHGDRNATLEEWIVIAVIEQEIARVGEPSSCTRSEDSSPPRAISSSIVSGAVTITRRSSSGLLGL